MQLKYDIDKREIGRRLREERRRAGHTQDSLSEKIGITSKYLSKIENGAASPSLPFIMRFSDITGSDLNYLLCGRRTADEPRSAFYESAAGYGDPVSRMSVKNRLIYDAVTEKLIEALEEYNK